MSLPLVQKSPLPRGDPRPQATTGAPSVLPDLPASEDARAPSAPPPAAPRSPEGEGTTPERAGVHLRVTGLRAGQRLGRRQPACGDTGASGVLSPSCLLPGHPPPDLLSRTMGRPPEAPQRVLPKPQSFSGVRPASQAHCWGGTNGVFGAPHTEDGPEGALQAVCSRRTLGAPPGGSWEQPAVVGVEGEPGPGVLGEGPAPTSRLLLIREVNADPDSCSCPRGLLGAEPRLLTESRARAPVRLQSSESGGVPAHGSPQGHVSPGTQPDGPPRSRPSGARAPGARRGTSSCPGTALCTRSFGLMPQRGSAPPAPGLPRGSPRPRGLEAARGFSEGAALQPPERRALRRRLSALTQDKGERLEFAINSPLSRQRATDAPCLSSPQTRRCLLRLRLCSWIPHALLQHCFNNPSALPFPIN